MYFTLHHDGGTPIRVESSTGREYAVRLCAIRNRVCILTSRQELLCGDLEVDTSRLNCRLIRGNVVDVDSDGSDIYVVDTNGIVWSSKWCAVEAKEDMTWHEIPIPNPRTCPHGMRNVNESIRVVAVNCNHDGVLFTTRNRELFAMGDFGEIAQSDIPILIECFRGLKILQVSTGENFAVVLTHKRLQRERQDNGSEASDASNGFLCIDCPKCVPDVNHHLAVHSKVTCGVSKSTTETSMASSPCLSDTFDAATMDDPLSACAEEMSTTKTSVGHLKIHKDAAINFLLDLSLSSEDYLIEAGKQTKLLKENVTNITTMVYEGVRTLSRHMSGSDNNDTVVEEATAGAVNGDVSLSETSSIDMGSTVDLPSESGMEGRMAKLARIGGALLATEVWCFGSVNRGQLGTGDHIKRARINAVLGLGGQGVVRVDSGKEHSMALTLDGRLYLWGNNAHRQISHEDTEDFSFPRRFQLAHDGNVLGAACGTQHSAIVMNDLTVHEQSDQQENNRTSGVSPFATAREIVEREPPMGTLQPVLASGSFTLFNHIVFGAIAKHLTAEQKFLQDALVAYNCILKPFLKRISGVAYSEIFDALCQNYLTIIHVAALNVKSLLEFGHRRITCTDIVVINNCQEMITLYRGYTKRFCDVMCIRGYPTIEMFTEKSSKEVHKIFFRPFRRIWAFIDMIYDLVALEEVEANRELLDERRTQWEKFSNEKDLAIEEAERTLRFWELNHKTPLAKLQSPDRRLILDSKELSLKRSQSARFTNQWFILFSDSLCSMSGHLTIFPLRTMWITSITDGETRKFALKVITPEETLILCAQNHEDKIMWLDGIVGSIKNCLGRVSDTKVPQYRNASYQFSEKHPKFPGAKYFGRWHLGQMHGIGHLEMSDGRVYNGQMNGGEIHGYGRMFTPNVGIYEGDFEHGKYNGYGVLEHHNKATYEGNFRDGLYCGHGTLIGEQFTYVGEFSNGSRHGYGVLDDNITGDKYMGMFVEGKKAGLGVCVTMCGDYFEGNFVNDVLAGEGIASFENSSYYEGEMTINGPTGRGCFYVGNRERRNSTECPIDSNGDVQEIEGTILMGNLSGTWQDVKISNGTLSMHQTFRKYSQNLGRYTIENDKKWKSLFDDWHVQLFGQERQNLENKQIWGRIACYITNSKAKDKLKSEGFITKNAYFYRKTDLSGSLDKLSLKSATGSLGKSSATGKVGPLDLGDVFHPLTSSPHLKGATSTIMDLGAFSQKLEEKFDGHEGGNRSFSPSESGSSVRGKNPTLDYIPNFGITKCDQEDLEAIQEYLREAFRDLNHPLGVLNSKISHCFYSSYGCWKFKPTAILHRHAMQEWESICRRIFSIVCRMFPAIGGTSFRKLLYPILLSEGIYSLLFVLYASKCSHRDEIYRQRMIGCDRKTDQELAVFLRVDAELMPMIKCSYFEDAIGCLKQVKDKYCPMEMVILIEKTFQLLEDAKNESVGAQHTLNADNTIPLVLFLVLRANIQHLGAEIALLEDLLGTDFEALMLGYTGYCVTTLKAAYQHILSDKFYQN